MTPSVLPCDLRRFSRLAPALLVVALSAGCARSKPVVEFPTLQALNRIAALPAREPTVSAGDVPATGWTVDPSHAAQSTQDLWQPTDAWGRAFQSALAAAGRPLRLARAMACTAQELGRFRLETKKNPPSTLNTFIVGACGAVVPQGGNLWLSASVPAELSDDELLKQWSAKLGPDLIAQLPQDATDVGFWFGRSGGQAVAGVAYSQSSGETKPFSLLADANGTVTIEGRVKDNVEHFAGYINQGRFGVESCLVDPGVRPPQFRIVCPMAPSDRTAWVQLVYAQPRRVLASLFLEALVRRTPSEPLSYTETVAGTQPAIGDKSAFSEAALTELNAVRAQAKLAPVQLAAAQSATAARLAGHYFAASLADNRDAQKDQIALGLMAGWQVDGMIRNGHFFAQLVPTSRDPGLWLNSALALPIGRSALLAADVEQIAVGPMLLAKPEGLGAVITGYQLHHGTDHANDVGRLLARLSFARQNLGLSPPKTILGMGPLLEEELKRVHTGTREPREVMHDVLEIAVDRLGQDVGGYVIETTSLEAFQIPPEVLKRPVLQVAVGVTHHKPTGSAWAQYAIFVVYLRSDPPGI